MKGSTPPAPQKVAKNLLAAARFEIFFCNVTQSYFQNLAGMHYHTIGDL